MRRFKQLTSLRFILSFVISICIPTFLLTFLVQIYFIDRIYDNTRSEMSESIKYLKSDMDRYLSNMSDIVNYFYMDDSFRTPEKI